MTAALVVSALAVGALAAAATAAPAATAKQQSKLITSAPTSSRRCSTT